MEREYVRVVPSTESYDPEIVIDVLRGLHHLSSPPDGSGVLTRIFGGETAPTIEFVVLSAGADAPVEFLYGIDGPHLETLESQLRTLYPDSFEITTTNADLTRRLTSHLESRAPVSDQTTSTDDRSGTLDCASPDTSRSTDLSHVPLSTDCSGSDSDPDPALHTTVGPIRPDENENENEDEEAALARPALESMRPVGLRWHGVGDRRRDWMCRLTPYSEVTDQRTDRGQPPLAVLVDRIGQADVPLAYQVVFRRRPSWSSERSIRRADIERGEDTRLHRLARSVGELLTGTIRRRRDRDELPVSDRHRLEEMEAVDPETTFTATVRALTLRPDTLDEDSVGGLRAGSDDSPDRTRPLGIDQLRGVLGPLSGDFYSLDPTPFRATRLRSSRADQDARAALRRFRSRELYDSGSGRSRPHVVLTPGALAGLVAVPSATDLDVPARRATRAPDATGTPLPRPNPDRLENFRDGMAVGHVIDEAHEPEPAPLRLPPTALTRHYARYGPTGSGKSKAVQNDILSLHDSTDGPTVLVDRKGDGMVQNYLRAHHARFGDLDDVYCLSLPDAMPAIPFFDVRPGVAAGRDRATVVQEKIEHFREILRLVMDESVFERAFVANEILAFLIEVLFDPQYQHDAFGLGKLAEAATRFQRDQQLPPTSAAVEDAVDSLTRQFEKPDRQFRRSMDAVLNRLDKLRENTHLAEVLQSVPEWDDTTRQYGRGTFDFRRLFGEDVVVLLDVGSLRAESSRALTLLLLSNLWDALQFRQQIRDDSRAGQSPSDVINLVVEEAAPIVGSPLVHEDLLPQGRSFGLSLGLVMQFPEQVRTTTSNRSVGQRAYRELLNNVHTQIVGGISLSEEFGRTLVTEDLDVETLRHRCNRLPAGEWIVDLPQTPFLESPPRPFSMRSLPIPDGHPESDEPLSDTTQAAFETAIDQLATRTRTAFCIEGPSPTAADDEADHLTADPLAGTPAPSTADPASPSLFDSSDSSPANRATAAPGTDDRHGADSAPRSKPVTDRPEAGGVSLPSVTPADRESGDDHLSPPSDSDRPPAEVVLDRVLAAMHRDLDGYSLLDGMSTVVDVDGVDVADLIDDGYLECHNVDRQPYYTITTDGLQAIGGTLETGPEVADLGEKTPHKVGVDALSHWFEQDGADDAGRYREVGGVIYDAVGYTDEELTWVGEVETDSNDYEGIAADYEKLAAVDARSIWVVRTHDVAVNTVLPALTSADVFAEPPSGRAANSMERLRETIEERDLAGMGTIRSFREILEEVGAR